MAERLDLRQLGGRWRWFFIDTDKDIEIPSNDDYVDVDDARAAAMKAFPDLGFADGAERAAPASRRPLLFLLISGFCFIGLLFLILRAD